MTEPETHYVVKDVRFHTYDDRTQRLLRTARWYRRELDADPARVVQAIRDGYLLALAAGFALGAAFTAGAWWLLWWRG